MTEPSKLNILKAQWAQGQFDKLSPQAKTDVRAVLKTLREKGSVEATTEIRTLADKRQWLHWELLALRDIIGTAHRHNLEL